MSPYDLSDCPKCGEWRDGPDADCAACGYDPSAPPVENPDPDLAYFRDGSVAGRVIGWAGGIPVIADLPRRHPGEPT